MRILSSIWAIALSAVVAAGPALADGGDGGGKGRGRGRGGDNSMEEVLPVLPPSAAVKLAMQAMPGAKPLGVDLRGGVYVVRLKQDGTITQLGVDPATGDVFPLE